MGKIYLSESQLMGIIRKHVLNEISQQPKAGGYVKAKDSIRKLQKMRSDGQRTYNKNGRTVDIDNEISRRERQMDTFAKGLGRDLANEYSPNRGSYQKRLNQLKSEIWSYKNEIEDEKQKRFPNQNRIQATQTSLKRKKDEYRRLYNKGADDYKVSSNGHDYFIDTPTGRAYFSYGSDGDRIAYDSRNSDSSNVNRLSQLRNVVDAMAGYDDELSGFMDKHIGDLKRRKKNWQDIQDYNDAHNRWEKDRDDALQAQRIFDKKPFFMKWGKKRPNDPPQEPQVPEWRRGEDGQYDGYFQSSDPQVHQKGIEDAQNQQDSLRKSKESYFKK